MRLVTFSQQDRYRIGVEREDGVVPLDEILPEGPADMLGLIAAGPKLLDHISAAMGEARPLASEDLRISAPVPVPAANIVCVGKNYYEHASEFEGSGFDASSGGQNIPEVPIFFTKVPGSVIGPGEDIDGSLDPDSTLDYEGELMVVIGKTGRGIKAEDAYDYVYGYTIINDVTARATQQRHRQWFLGKSFDTFCPMGPAIVTSDEIPDVTRLKLETHVNGELRQSASVADLIFDIPTIIETLSRSITLRPGDLIATGTPAGVGIGFDPPRYLQAGDHVAVTIEPIGTLSNRVA